MAPIPSTRRDLTRPILFSGESGGLDLAVLTGGNVDLAPEPVARVLDGVPWNAAGRKASGTRFLAFARTRHGLAGAWGEATGAAEIDLHGTFGQPEGAGLLGDALASYLGDGRRFAPGAARVALPEGPAALAIAAALGAGGVAVAETDPQCRFP